MVSQYLVQSFSTVTRQPKSLRLSLRFPSKFGRDQPWLIPEFKQFPKHPKPKTRNPKPRNRSPKPHSLNFVYETDENPIP